MPPKQRQVSGKQTSASQQQQQHAQATSTTAGTSDTVTAEPTTSIGAVSASYGHKGSRGTADAGAGFGGALQQLWTNYVDQTPKNLKLCDAFCLFLMLTGVVQFVYCLAITNYPFNAFIGGFAATVGQFVLTASMRSQVNPKNRSTFSTISPERAFADYVFGTLVLQFFVYNYLG